MSDLSYLLLGLLLGGGLALLAFFLVMVYAMCRIGGEDDERAGRDE